MFMLKIPIGVKSVEALLEEQMRKVHLIRFQGREFSNRERLLHHVTRMFSLPLLTFEVIRFSSSLSFLQEFQTCRNATT